MMMDNNNNIIIIDQLISLSTSLSTYLPLTPLATLIGLTCLIAQINLTLLLDKRGLSFFLWGNTKEKNNGVSSSSSSSSNVVVGPWNELPGFTAHQLIALPSMCILTYCGIQSWFFATNNETTDDYGSIISMDTPYQRIFGQSNINNIPLAIGSGAILLWDIPSSYFIKELNDPLMGLHHVGMFMVATVMGGIFCGNSQQMIGYYYVPYYFGVIEMSSVPLSYVDVFHPKYKYYYEWLNNPQTQHQTKMKILQSVNEFARILFAILFLILRGVYFPYVTFYHVIPDLWIGFNYSQVEGRPHVPEDVPMWTGYFLIGAVSSFAILQCYWGILILKQIYKMVVNGDSSDVGGSKKTTTMKKNKKKKSKKQ